MTLGKRAPVMPPQDPSRTPQLLSVVHTHRVNAPGRQAVDAEAISAMVAPGTVQVVAIAEVQPDMGAALGCPEEDQITGPQQAMVAGANRYRLAEALLLVGIPGQPNPDRGKGSLH